MALSPRSWLAVCATALSFGAVAATLPAGAAAAGTSRACGGPALSVRAGGSSTVTGSMLVAGSGRLTVVRAAGSQTHVSETAATWLAFCLRLRAVAKNVTLVRIDPAGVSVSLTRTGRITVSSNGGVTASVARIARDERVQVLLDRRHAQVSIFVNGGHQAAVPATIPTVVRLHVGDPVATAAGAAGRPAGSSAGDMPVAVAA
jgi:hypothetical protein